LAEHASDERDVEQIPGSYVDDLKKRRPAGNGKGRLHEEEQTSKSQGQLPVRSLNVKKFLAIC
jgi:hypothetical protein